MDDFLIRALLAAIGIAVAAGPLGCFVVWRRMAYFGDATAHAALLGVALSLILSLPPILGVLAIAVLIAISVSSFSGKGYAGDTLLGVVAHMALACGLILMSYISGPGIDVMGYLFGDVLSVNTHDVAFIWLGSLGILGLLWVRWPRMILSTLSPDLAKTAQIDPKREELIFTLTLAVLVALSIKVVGALLITALLIIPAATARAVSSTPDRMALFAAIFGAVSACLGLLFSLYQDAPTGPSIVAATGVLFLITTLLRKIFSVKGGMR